MIFTITFIMGILIGVQLGIAIAMLMYIFGLKIEFWVTRYLKKRFPSTFNSRDL